MKKPKKLIKLPKPKLPKAVPRPLKALRRPAKSAEERLDDALSTVPRITNETVSEHREAVLSGARKYIYPLQHSKHRVVRISLILFSLVIVSFFAFCGLSLYRFHTTSGFMYDVTRIIPFPIAKTGSDWVSYESYLFELRHNMHYYQTQQQADFSTTDGRAQLDRLRRQAMAQVLQDAYVKQLADRHHVRVGTEAVDAQVALLRGQNRLGSNQRVFRDVLNEYWGWDEADFQRKLHQELLQQAVVARLDTATADRAAATLAQLRGGADFAALASQVSDDLATKAAGGQYPAAITINDRDLPPTLTDALFRLQPGQTSAIINTGYTLEILKVIDAAGGTAAAPGSPAAAAAPDTAAAGTAAPAAATSRHAAHIQFRFQPITTYTRPLEKAQPPRFYVKT